MWGWGHLPPESVGTELGSSVIMLFPPLPGRKREIPPSNTRPNQKSVPTPSSAAPRSEWDLQKSRALEVGGVRGGRALMVWGLEREKERERESARVCKGGMYPKPQAEE